MNEIAFLMSNKDEILENEEKNMFINYNQSTFETKIAEKLCQVDNDLSDVKLHEFRKYMQNEQVSHHCAHKLFDIHFKDPAMRMKQSMNEIQDLIKNCDRYLFIMFRNKEITLD